jgi:hypothetical protein
MVVQGPRRAVRCQLAIECCPQQQQQQQHQQHQQQVYTRVAQLLRGPWVLSSVAEDTSAKQAGGRPQLCQAHQLQQGRPRGSGSPGSVGYSPPSVPPP